MPKKTKSSSRLPGTPADVWISGFCSAGAHVGEKFSRGEGYPVCGYEFANPTWLKTKKCGCSCHWAEHGKIIKSQQDGSRPDLMPQPPKLIEVPVTQPRPGRQPGELELLVKKVCDEYIVGAVALKPGRKLTPDMVAQIIEAEGSGATSAGAVSSIFDRWLECGFAVILGPPKHFDDYTDQGRELGLAALKEAWVARKRAERFG